MLEKSLGLLFYLKKPKNFSEGKRIPIYLRITVDGIPKELSTKRQWYSNKWNPKAGRATGTKEDVKSLNAYLDILQAKAYDARRILLERGEVITSIAIKNILSGQAQRSRMLLALFEKHNDEMKKLIEKGIAKGTWSNFNTTYSHVHAFIKWKYKVDDLSILSLDMDFIKSLYAWLRSEKASSFSPAPNDSAKPKKRTEKNLGHNSAIKNIANLKKIVLDCVENGWLRADPFAKFEMTREDVFPTFLMKEEIQAIAAKDIAIERLARVRDIYIFCCFTGLSFIDVKQLKRSEVSIGIDGNLWIDKKRQKSSVLSKIPLLPITLAILEKYKDDPVCINSDVLLPVLSNQKYNAYLKEIADICDVQKDLTSHTARHTFGTSVTLANGVPIESVSKMLGHKSIKQTQHYARVLPIKVSEDMQVLKQKLENTNFLRVVNQ